MSSSTSNQPDPPNLTLTTIEPSHDTAYWSWEKQKTRIWNLLYHEKVPQKDLPKRMKAQFGFSAPPSAREYTSHLKNWGFSRKNPEELNKNVGYRVYKRQMQGKASTVIVAGVRWSADKTQRVADLYSKGPLPERLRENTASQDTFEWPPDLPWLRFMKNLSEAPIDIIGLMVRRFRHAKPGLATNELSNLKYNATLLQEASYLGLWFPRGISDPAKLSKFLRHIMPETIPGEHLLRSQHLNKDFDSAARELLWSALTAEMSFC
ncbi:hypothetical protein PG999_001313 [Apiospora kogelbergensis]|uniref:Clr5 domain-containing protein n=1 Tax=Apiospora kogelbergensis TaxID=1337665 RepID=A0AAW0RDZ2_9PEZI